MFLKKEVLVRLRLIAVIGFLVMGVLQSESRAAWTKITIPGTTKIQCVAVADSILFASTDTGVFRSINNGTTWQKVTGLNVFGKLAGNTTTLFAGEMYSTPYPLFSSTDHGASWNMNKTMDSTTSIGIIDFSVQNNEILFVQNSRSYLSENNGQSWATLNTTIGATPICCHIMDNILFLGGNAGVYCSSNSGHAWHESNYGIRYTNIRRIASQSKYLYAGLPAPDTKTAVYCSIDSGFTWKSMGLKHDVKDFAFSKTMAFVGAGSNMTGDSGGVFAAPLDSSNWTDISMLPKAYVSTLAIDTGYLYATTQNYDSSGNPLYSLYRRPLSEVNALLKRQVPGPQSVVSNNFVIDHFASQHALGITFNPGRTEKVCLRVFSATGKAVATLFDGQAQSRDNKFIWDYKNMSSGIYCISLQSENGKAVKKVQVMR